MGVYWRAVSWQPGNHTLGREFRLAATSLVACDTELEAEKMNIFFRLSRLVQVDLDAYFVFRDTLCGASGIGPRDKQYREKCSGLTFTIIDQSHLNTAALDALIVLMQSGGLLSPDSKKAQCVIEQRLKNGDACATAWDAYKVVGFFWMADKKSHVYKHFANCVANIRGSAVLYQTYVDSDYRGQRLQINLDRVSKEFFRSNGMAKTHTFVGVKNFASIRNSMRVNEEFKLIYHLSLKGPKGRSVNFYPKWSAEAWIPCRHETTYQKMTAKDSL